MSADDRRYLIFRYRDKIHNRKERIAFLTGEVRAQFKQAKAEGVTKAEIEEAIKAKTPEGRLSMLARVQDIKFALEPYPEGTQFAMDFGSQPPEPPMVTAAREGRLAFDNEEAPTGGRWAPGSPEHQAWLDAYQRKMAGRVRERIQPLKAGGPTPIETAIEAAAMPDLPRPDDFSGIGDAEGEAVGQAIDRAIATENFDRSQEQFNGAIDDALTAAIDAVTGDMGDHFGEQVDGPDRQPREDMRDYANALGPGPLEGYMSPTEETGVPRAEWKENMAAELAAEKDFVQHGTPLPE